MGRLLSNVETIYFRKLLNDHGMKNNFFWRPIANNLYPIDRRLLAILANENLVEVPLNETTIDFLRGLRAAGIPGADDLIEAIEKYGTIEVYEMNNETI